MEKTHERIGKFICRLGDLGLGNPEGIPSSYADKSPEELNEIAEAAAGKLVMPTTLDAVACIDGRETLGYADGSEKEVRLRRAGGTSSNLGVALSAEAPIANALSSDMTLEEQTAAVDNYVTESTGFKRSAHLGGCGKANGEVADHEATHENPNILKAVKVFLDIPEVKAYFSEGHEDELEAVAGSLYSDELIERVREASGKTAAFLRESGWNGQEYVDDVVKKNPRGVENLKVDHNDEKFHGHKERSLKIILGDETDDDVDDFVWNLKASKMVAESLAGERGIDGYRQALIEEAAMHMAVGHRLPSSDTPIFLLRKGA